MEISDLVPSGSASVEGVFVERFVIIFYCSLSVHVTVLSRSHRLPPRVGLTQARPNYSSLFAFYSILA